MSSQNKTNPTPKNSTLEQAIALAKNRKKSEARKILRAVVAEQPLNQAAWIWLSAMAVDRAEAETALAQAKKLNPEHPSVTRAEQWLVHRFSEKSTTQQSPVVQIPGQKEHLKTPPAEPPPAMPPEKTDKKLFTVFNAFAFGLALLAVVIGLLILFFGLIVEISGAAKANNNIKPAVSSETGDADAVPGGETGNDSGPKDENAALHAELDAAWVDEDWPQAASALEQLREREPDSERVVQQLSVAYFRTGISLRDRGFVKEALSRFEQSLQIVPEQPRIKREVRLASAYLAGSDHYQAGQWPEAIAELEKARAEDPNYINTRDLLYSAYLNRGMAQQAARELGQAKQAFESAVHLRPDLDEPHRLLAEVELAMVPPTPEPAPTPAIEDRLILVGIAEQQMWVFDGEEKVFDFVVSTGEPGRDTAVGEFEILNKIDVAYAGTWNLDMPFWMGIYWAGPLQNGIHSLPIVKHTGYKLWDGYLGQRVSYGCVILSDEDAATLYDWTEVGTKVKIVPSLAYWSPEVE